MNSGTEAGTSRITVRLLSGVIRWFRKVSSDTGLRCTATDPVGLSLVNVPLTSSERHICHKRKYVDAVSAELSPTIAPPAILALSSSCRDDPAFTNPEENSRCRQHPRWQTR